ncbi:ribonuclease H-like domain-containing protein, partial [Tanacetum coccineum]
YFVICQQYFAIFKIVDENLVLLRAPRKNDVYSLNLKNIIPSGGVTCLVAKASEGEALLWHRRLGHANFKNINKLVKSNHDRRSTSGGCQYLGRRLVSWQCKKQTIVAISSTEAEYVAAASCCGQGRVGFEEMLSEIGRFCFDQ